ncbi:hypothetical protein S40293_04134 [Stachybotrys chartarum IBT 40293]|nr:hypothetical protein S40293_04134 [Stachybotrys chartarum IBT 40293]
MRNGLLPGLLFLSGAAAWETMAVAPLEVFKHSGYHHHSPSCSSTVRPGEWSPDPSTFFFPHTGGHGHSWDLCKDGYHCSPHDAIGKVYFTFKDGQFVVELVNNYGFPFEDVKVHIQTGHPPHSKSPKYSLKNGYCRAGDYHHGHYYPHHSGRHHGPVKCHVPYHEMLHDGPHKNVCPLEGKGSWILYIQIEAVISGHWGHEKIKVYNRGIKDDICWFSLSYCCSQCKKPEYKHLPKAPKEEDCKGAELIVYGTGRHSQPLYELGWRSHPETCREHSGHYHRASCEELEASIGGVLEIGHKAFADFQIELIKEGDEAEILVSVRIRNEERKYVITEVKIFVDCDGGEDKHYGHNICAADTYQNVLVRESGVRDALLSIDDEFQCSGDYFIAVFVRVCVADKVNTCGYHRIR